MCRRLPFWLAAELGFESARRHTVQVLQVGLLLEVGVAVPGGGRGAVLDHGGRAEKLVHGGGRAQAVREEEGCAGYGAGAPAQLLRISSPARFGLEPQRGVPSGEGEAVAARQTFS